MVFKRIQEYVILYILIFILDSSAVPLKNPNINSSHESQVEQSIEQGSDENFEPEPDLMETISSESKESSVSDLIAYCPTEHDVNMNF